MVGYPPCFSGEVCYTGSCKETFPKTGAAFQWETAVPLGVGRSGIGTRPRLPERVESRP